ncbi:MAG: DUF2125 domain-containing protein [Pseudodonghicola sp.]
MRRLAKLAVLLALLWSGMWLAAGYGLRAGIDGWFAAQRRHGWQADYATLSTAGYPLRHVTTIDGPALADPGTGAAWRGDWLRLESPAVWPGRQTLRFPDTPQRLSFFDRTSVIRARDMQARLDLRLGQALELQRLALTSGDWRLEDPQGAVMGADDLTLSMAQGDRPERYRIEISAADFTPGAALRLHTGSAAALPPGFDRLVLTMEVSFDRPWDRRALEQRRPQPREIALEQADIHWGALRLQASGSLRVDAQGIPSGEIALRAENWREMLAMAQAAGAIPPQALEPVERVLTLLSGGDGAEVLDSRLRFAEGLVALGPLPLGPAPRLLLR